MTKLSVNINKVALLRNARGSNYPNLVQVARDCEKFGAQGITVHPRPDERHIRYADIPELKRVVTTELNIEGNPVPKFLELVTTHKPLQCTLVPDMPSALTSDTGWDTITHASYLKDIIVQLKEQGIRVSLFVNPDPQMVAGAKACGADRIELYTGDYASGYTQDKQQAIAPFVEAAEEAVRLGIGINAGHDLNLENTLYFKQHIPNLLEVSIGHALFVEAIYLGLNNVIQLYLQRLKEG